MHDRGIFRISLDTHETILFNHLLVFRYLLVFHYLFVTTD